MKFFISLNTSLTQVIFRLLLQLLVDADKSAFFDFQPFINRIDEEWQLALTGGVLLRRSLDLAKRKFNAHALK